MLELKSGWCQTASMHDVADEARSAFSHSYCADPTLAAILLLSARMCHAPAL